MTLAHEARPRRWKLDGDEISPGRVALRRLGGGGDYEVYLVWDDRLCAPAAAKLIRPDRVDDEGPRRRLANEAELLSALVHPGLPRCYDVDLDGPTPHAMLELVEGPALNRLVRREGRLDALQVLSLGVQIAGVLHFLALSGIVHLDVKPGNVVMSAAPKLIDLSLARSIDAAARIESAVGTAPYLSPEQCLASTGALVGPAADVWGLGITLYRAASGQRPFREVEWSEVPSADYPQVHEGPIALDADVPDFIAHVIYDCLSPTPDLRPSPAEVLVRLETGMATLAPHRLARW